MRKIIIAGNWKMNKTEKETVELITALRTKLIDVAAVDIVVCPVFTSLSVANDILLETNIGLGAQNLHWEDSGAFTGEISASMIKSVGAQYVIIGHSERRQFFGETNETVNKKIKAALKEGLKPIVCIGEVLEDREAGKTFDVIKGQCEGSLANLTSEEMGKIILAYEPVWAIGTGKTASPQQAQEVHKYIRDLLVTLFSEELAQSVRIQYGGSVKPENSADLMSQPDIDGALVGGASLKCDSFVGIIEASCAISK